MSRAELEGLLDAEGFARQYDFIYLPVDMQGGECYGYGFVNLVSAVQARRFVRHFHGYRWPAAGHEPIWVHASEALEGLDALVGRYRNSPLMHRSVPEKLRPTVYRDGVKVCFPEPTERLRPPRRSGRVR